MAYYPRHIYSSRTDVTRANMRRYDKLNEEFWNEVYSTPGYKDMTGKEQMILRLKIKEKDKYSYLH